MLLVGALSNPNKAMGNINIKQNRTEKQQRKRLAKSTKRREVLTKIQTVQSLTKK